MRSTHTSRLAARFTLLAATALVIPATVSAQSEAPATASAPIDFNMHYMVMGVEGPEMKRPYFEKGPVRIVFRPIDKCRFLASGDSFRIIPELFPGAEIELSRSPMPADKPFTGEDFLAYRDAAEKLLPASATNPEFLPAETQNPFPINNWDGRQFLFRYASANQNFKRSVIFLSLDPGDQIMVTISAPEERFDHTMAIAQQFFNSWHYLTEDVHQKPIFN